MTKKMKFTRNQRAAMKRICVRYSGFNNLKKLQDWFKINLGEILDTDWFLNDNEYDCYTQLENAIFRYYGFEY